MLPQFFIKDILSFLYLYFQFEDEAWEISAQLMEELSPTASSASSSWIF